MNLADKIRAAREAAGLSQEELARRVGVALRTVGNWERGRTDPRQKLGSIERVLGVSLREQEPDTSPRIASASDSEIVVNLSARLAERNAAIRERDDIIATLRAELAQLQNSVPTQWAARARDDFNTPNGGDRP